MIGIYVFIISRNYYFNYWINFLIVWFVWSSLKFANRDVKVLLLKINLRLKTTVRSEKEQFLKIFKKAERKNGLRLLIVFPTWKSKYSKRSEQVEELETLKIKRTLIISENKLEKQTL